MKKISSVIIMIITIYFLAGCSQETNSTIDENEFWGQVSYSNDYLEEEIELPDELKYISDICIMEGNVVRVAGTDEEDSLGTVWESEDGGATWKLVISYTDVLQEYIKEDSSVAAIISPQGELCVHIEKDETHQFYMINKDLSFYEINVLSNMNDAEMLKVEFTSTGELLIAKPMQIVLLDSSNEKIETEYNINGMVNAYEATEEQLYAIIDGKFTVFDLKTGEEGEVGEFENVAKNIDNLKINGNANILSIKGENETTFFCALNTYNSDFPGLMSVSHSEIEGVIDGSSTYLGHYDYYLGKIIEKDKNTLFGLYFGQPDKVVKYTYNPEKASTTKELTVYSLKNNNVIRQNMILFQQQNPGIRINLELGIPEGKDITIQDAIKTLNTELAAGRGPDVIVLDGLPIESYIEQKLLEDITSVVDEANTDNQLYDAIVYTYKKNDKLQAVPTRFSAMVIEGEEAIVNEGEDFNKLTDTALTLPKNEIQIFNPFSFDHIATISYRTYLAYKLTEETSISKEILEEYYSALQTWYGMVEMGEASEKNICDVSLSPSSYRDYDHEHEEAEPYQLSLDYITSEWDYQLLLDNQEISYSVLTSESNRYFLPSIILGITSTSENIDESKKFIKFALSKEGQISELYQGLKVNKNAVVELVKSDDLKLSSFLERKFTEDEEKEMSSTLASLNCSANTNVVLMNIVLGQAEVMLKDKISAEEAAEEAMKKVKLYLAE